MGRVYNKFSTIHYTNESSVEQKFILPFLTEFLGYKPNNIMPQELYKVIKKFPINRDKELSIEHLKAEGKPDYLVIDDRGKIFFIIDAKHPEEDVSNYKNQLIAYCAAYEVNIIMVTNGIQFRIYNFAEIIIDCHNLEEIDEKFDDIKKILHEKNQRKTVSYRIAEIIKTDQREFSVSLPLTDYLEYLKKQSHLSRNITVLGENLVRLTEYELFHFKIDKNKIVFKELLSRFKNGDKYFLKGGSGIGKSEFINYLISLFSRETLNQKTHIIPIKVELRFWGSTSTIKNSIKKVINLEDLSEREITYSLNDGQFLLFFDGLDEIQHEFKNSFFRHLLEIEKLYSNNCFVIISKPGIDLQKLENTHIQILMEPPHLDEIEDYINSNLKKLNFIEFRNLIEKLNLIDLIQSPLFLNFTLVYIDKLGKMPEFRYTILEDLLNYYFKAHIDVKFVSKIGFNLIKAILSNLAYNLFVVKNKRVISERDYVDLVKEFLNTYEKPLEITDEITIQTITEFLISFNFLVKYNTEYEFWHYLMMEYFATYQLINKINANDLEISYDKLLKSYHSKDLLIQGFLKVENKEFQKFVKNNNLFLYIESILLSPILQEEEINFIRKYILSKLKSGYFDIRQISLNLCEKFISFLPNSEEFLVEIINEVKNQEVVEWVILRIGECKTETAKEFLLQFEKTDIISHPYRFMGSYKDAIVLSLSNFDDQETQNFLINLLESEWQGDSFLNSIIMALSKILKRDCLTKESFERIFRIFENPKVKEEIDPKFKSMIIFTIRKSINKLIIQYNDNSLISRLIKLYQDKNDILLELDLEEIISEIMEEEDLMKFIRLIGDPETPIMTKILLSNILIQSKIEIDAILIFSLLEKVKKLRALTEESSSVELDVEKRNYDNVYGIILNIFGSDTSNLINLDLEKLYKYVKDLHSYPNPYIQKAIIEIYGKYFTIDLLNIAFFYGIHHFVRLFELSIKSDELQDQMISKLSYIKEKCLKSPDDFFNPILLLNLIEKLVQIGLMEEAKALLDEYLASEPNIGKFNLYFLKFLNKMPKDYTLQKVYFIIDKLKEDTENFSSQMYILLNITGIIDDESFVKKILEIAEEIARNGNPYIYERILNGLIPRPIGIDESKIISIIEAYREDEQVVFRALNLLAFIGSEGSIDYISEFLLSEIDRIKQIAFFCIQKIYERKDLLWYNGEESQITP